MKASAATKTYTAPYSGTTINYSNSNVTTFSSNENVTITSSNSGSFTIKVKANPSASSRTITLYAKKSGTTVDTLVITQNGVPTKAITADCTGGNYTFTVSNASSYAYSNTAVCNSRSGSSFVVKPNSTTSKRSCTVTVKNKNGTVIYYVYINQNAVPVKAVSVKGNATSFPYGNSNASTLTPQNKSMITKVTASNPGSFTVSVSANPSDSATRSSDIIVKNSAGAYIEIIRVTQEKYTAVTHTYNYNSDPRTVTYTSANSDPSKTTVSNTAMAVCTSQGSGKYQIKLTQNTATAARSCTITFKDQNGMALEKYVINQSGVPLKPVSVGGNTTSFPYGNTNAATINPQNKSMITKVTASNPGSFTISVSANPSGSATRSSDIIVKNSSGVYLEIIRVPQEKYIAETFSFTYNSDPHTLTYYVSDTDPSKTVVSDASMGSAVSVNATKYTVKITQNPSSASRSCTFSFKDSFGTVLEYLVITQTGVPVKTVSVEGEATSFSYGNTDVTTFSIKNDKMITGVSASNAGSFTFSVSANPSAASARSSNIIAKASNGTYVEIIRVKQAKFIPPTVSYSVNSKRSTVTYVNSNAARFAYSNKPMCNSVKSTGGTHKFVIKANAYDARSGIITVYDKFDTVIAKLSVTQSKAATYRLGSGAGEYLTYTNKEAVDFNLPANISSVRKISDGRFIFTQTVNRGTEELDYCIQVLDANKNIIQYLNVISLPNIMRINSSFDKDIPNIGKSFDVTFETSNPTTVTLENAYFSDTKSNLKKINKNSVRPNAFDSTSFNITVDTLNSTWNRTVTIKITNGLETETMTLTQLGQQIGFRAATKEYPLGSLGRDHYVYKIVASEESGWTQIGKVIKLTDRSFNLCAALLPEMEETQCVLDFAIINGANAYYNGADNCFVYATFYKDASDNRYVLLTGDNSDTMRYFFDNSNIKIDDEKNGVKFSYHVDGDHANLPNWVFWVGTDGKLKMNIRKFSEDCFIIDGTEITNTIGYRVPSSDDAYTNAYYVLSLTYNVPSRFQTMLNKLGR